MSTLATLVVKLVGDAGDFRDAMQQAADDTESFGSRVQQAGQVALGIAGGALATLGAAVAAIGPKAIDAASSLSESMSKASVVFGDASSKVIAFADSASWAFGLAKGQAVESASTFGNLFVTMGLGKDSAADMSVDIVKLASDLASFNNLNTPDVLEKLRSGLIGEAEPLRSLGVMLTEDAVKQKAMSMGLAKTTVDLGAVAKATAAYNDHLSVADDILHMYGPNSKQYLKAVKECDDLQKKLNATQAGSTGPITEAMKLQARYALILEQTKTAQGDFARTSDGLANTQRILGAVWQNLITDVGTTFLPIVKSIANEFATFAKGVLPRVQNALKGIQPVMEDIGNSIGIFVEVLTRTGDPLAALSGFMENFPSIKPTVNGMIASIRGFIAQVQRVIAVVSPYIQQAATWVSQNVKLQDVFTALGIAIASVIIPALVGLVAGAAPVVGAFLLLVGIVTIVRRAWEENWGGIRDTLTAAWSGTILPALTQLWTWLQVAVPQAIQTLSDFWTNTLQPALVQVWAFIQTSVLPLLGQLWTWLATNVPAAIQTLSDFWTNTLQPALAAVWSFIQTSVIPALGQLWTWLATNVPAAIQTVVDFVNGTLLPAFNAAWAFVQTYIIPVFQTLANVVSIVLTAAWQILVDFWNAILYPMLSALWTFISESVVPLLDSLAQLVITVVTKAFEGMWTMLNQNVLPVFKSLWDWINNQVIPVLKAIADVVRGAFASAFQWAKDNVLQPFIDALQFIQGLISDIMAAIRGMTSALNGVKLPGSEPAGRAVGGPVDAGTPYIVGERGPELFVPATSGTIDPNVARGSTVNNFNLTIHSSAPVENVVNDFAMLRALAGAGS